MAAKKKSGDEIQDLRSKDNYKYQTQPMFDLKELKTINLYKDGKDTKVRKDTPFVNYEKTKIK